LERLFYAPSQKELFMIGSTEIIVIAIVILVLFGGSALPKFARSIGEAKKEFSKAAKDEEEESKKSEAKKEGDAEKKA
jgi:sec-independent protein translocase protein TatA